MKTLTPTRTRPRTRTLVTIGVITVAVLACAVLASRWFLSTGIGRAFLETYPGYSELPADSPVAAPAWLQWQHALNFFLIVLIIRSGWLLRTQTRPEAFWTRHNRGRFKTKKSPTKMSLYLWLHLTLDVVWVVNGFLFVVLLFATDGWKRIVPVHWDVVPNAVSAGVQYLALQWPLDDPWVNYNALQVLAYFTTALIAAPLAAVTGVRLSPVWSNRWKISRFYPGSLARAIHLPVMFYFVVFIIIHVGLVFATGMKRNLNFMYASQPPGSESWWGFAIFAVTLLVVVAGWIAARPLFMQPVASLTGKVTSR